MNRRWLTWCGLGCAVALLAAAVIGPVRIYAAARRIVLGEASIAARIKQYGPAAEARLKERFGAAGVEYPPVRLVLVGLKTERELRVLVPAGTGWKEAARYRVLGASGGPGPKLRQGDQQVPEGFYEIESLNPNSLYHLAIRVNYPNAEDRKNAAAEGRTKLGGDIMIHGKDGSVGCLAMGDPAIEELFVLADRVGIANVEVVLAPSTDPKPVAGAPAWVADLYARLSDRLNELGVSPPAGPPQK